VVFGLTSPRIINLRSRQNPPASGLCLPSSTPANKSYLHILQCLTPNQTAKTLTTRRIIKGEANRRQRRAGGAPAGPGNSWNPCFPRRNLVSQLTHSRGFIHN
jgi:hypothetical protein